MDEELELKIDNDFDEDEFYGEESSRLEDMGFEDVTDFIKFTLGE